MNLIQKIVGTKNERELKKMRPVIARINELEPSMAALSNEDFPRKTAEWKEQVQQQGRTLDDLLPEAFALVREAGKRVLGQRHFDVQMIGGMTLHSGRIAEMRTGEGKTLTATLPSYLNALSGRGVHVVTVNDYLAKRDSEWMGRLHNFLGLSVGCILNSLTDRERQVAYRADITYGQNNEFGFDYLRDNMKFRLEDYVQRELNFAIVDEVDSILIDEARTPLIISGQSDQAVDRYYEVDRVIPGLMPDQHYTIDEKSRSVTLTDEGVARIEQRLGIANLYAAEEVNTLHHVEQALRAHTLFKRDIDYVVKDGEVLIVDEHTGRTLPGRRWSDGLHQAIEAKEGLVIESETQTLATISFQNYFRMYSKLSGMTGTADTEAEEFAKIYDLDVLVIPTNRPMIRVDNEDVVYKTESAKFRAAADEIELLHRNGQPVLVGTVSVAKSEALSSILKRRGIPHEVLNAKQHAREADIVAQAGRKGAVTIATNMAGRGTDIILGGNPEFLAKKEVGPAPEMISAESRPTLEEIQAHQTALAEYKAKLDAATEKYKVSCKTEQEEVRALGGLFILGTERHESRRIDNQLRGRSGRQGDPGGSRFYLSLEDDLMRIFGTDKLKSMMEFMGMEDNVPIEAKMLSGAIENAQKQVEGRNFDIRKNLLDYDDVMNQQRTAIYKLRRRVLAAGAGFPLIEYEPDPKNKKKKLRIETTVTWNDARERTLDLIDDCIQNLCNRFAPTPNPATWNVPELRKAMRELLGIDFSEADPNAIPADSRTDLEDKMWKLAEENFVAKEGLIGADYFRRYEQYVYLSTIDTLWKDHLLDMDHLREGIGLRGYGHRDPKQEYKKEGYDMFVEMMHSIDATVVGTLMHSQLEAPAPSASAEQAERQREEAMSEYDLSKKRLPKMTTSKADVVMGGDSESAAAQAMAPAQKQQTVTRTGPKIRPNDPCYCGSGKKYKRCHGPIDGAC